MPPELRLQIWQDACLPSSQHRRGLHYMDVEVDKHENRGWSCVTALRCDWTSPPEKRDSIGRNNRSAYLWDAGLWRACKESREVILRHSHINDWIRIEKPCGIRSTRYVSQRKKNWIGGEEAVPPGVLTLREGDEEWHLMVYPERDMFCVSESVCATLLCSVNTFFLHFSFVDCYGDVHYFDGKNLALEFDPSWNLDWNFDYQDHDIVKLRCEDSFRGFLANRLAEVADDIDFTSVPRLWLIDKNTQWIARPGRNLSTVYHDCDGEYVEIDWRDTRSDTRKSASRGAVADFIEKLGDLCDDGYREDVCHAGDMSPCYGCYYCDRFSVEEAVRLLVRQDNEVKDFRNDEDSMGDYDDVED
ncbi:hypothetical protein ACHAPJ_013039 [Fusarium lateritium]